MAVGLSLLVSAAATALATAGNSARPASPADSARTPVSVAAPSADSSANVAAGGGAPTNPLVTSVSGALTRAAIGVTIPRAVVPAPAYRKLTNGRLVADSLVVVKSERKLTLFYR